MELNGDEARNELCDVAVMNALGPHLAMHHRVLFDRSRSETVRDEADLSGWTVMSVHSDGVIEASSARAEGSTFLQGRRLPAELAGLLAERGSIEPAAHLVE